MKNRGLKTKVFNYPIAEANRVIKEISALIRLMSKDYVNNDLTTDRLKQLEHKYKAIFDSKSQDWANRISSSAFTASDHQFRESLKDISKDISIGKLELSDGIKQVFKLSVDDNVSLFKTIPAQFHSKVSNVVYNAISGGQGAYDIAKTIRQFDNQTRNYTQLRTMDQSRKAFSALSRERMINAGVKKFQWFHVGGTEHPRKLHQELNGKVFNIDNPPYIGDMYQQRIYGYPAQLPNCRCKAKYVFADLT